jgi:hypothetical protein
LSKKDGFAGAADMGAFEAEGNAKSGDGAAASGIVD